MKKILMILLPISLFLSFGFSQQEYNSNDLIEMDNGLYTIKFSDEPITGKVFGIDSNILFKKDGSKQVFDEPVIIKDIKGELEEQIKIQYFNNSSVNKDTTF